MFYNARIGSRKPETKIKRCWNWSTLKRTVSSSAQQLSGSSPFSPKIHNFDLQPPKYVSKDSLQVHELKRAFKNTFKHEIKCYFNTIHQFNPFLQNPQQQLDSYHKSKIMKTQGINHQQQYLITTTTSIKHDFINNSFFIIYG